MNASCKKKERCLLCLSSFITFVTTLWRCAVGGSLLGVLTNTKMYAMCYGVVVCVNVWNVLAPLCPHLNQWPDPMCIFIFRTNLRETGLGASEGVRYRKRALYFFDTVGRGSLEISVISMRLALSSASSCARAVCRCG